MSKQPTTHRRAFIIGSTAIAGGVAFGLYTLSRPHKNPLEAQLDEGELTFNPWVKINANGVILIAPHTDLGQGARSLQAALIAEEMDLELHQFTVETGPPAGAYWNTAVANNIAPFMARDRSLASNTTRRVVSSAVHLLGVQITGGSTTAADVYNKLRVAGAVARETLKLAAAAQAEIPVSELRTAKGAVILPDNRVIPYTRLAEVAANISPVTNVDLRPPSEWRLVGKDMLRLDIKEKSTGTSIYGIDISMPDMVHATVCTNPRIGGTMNSYDASEAKDMPGVKAILKISNGVAVIANNTWNAISAAKSIQFDWGPAPYPPEIETHWNMLSDSFREENLDGEWRNEGHIDETLTKNTPTRTLEYRAPYLAHAPLEPLNATIKMTSDRIEIWASHQVPRMVQNIISRITGISTENISFYNQYAGGSFGHRLEFENIRYAAEVAIQMQGIPIKLTYSREEDFAHEFPRQIAMSRATGLLSAEQHIEALDIGIASPSVMASQGSRVGLPTAGADGEMAAGVWNAPYIIPHLRVRTYKVDGLAPVSSWRSVGASTGGFFIESVIDELIHEASRDPLEERIRMCNYPLATKVLEAVGEMSNWGSDLAPNQGRGIALVISFGVPTAEVVEVTQTPKGILVNKVWVAAEVGRILDPINFDNQVKGGVIWGLGHAMNCETIFKDGKADPTNYHNFEGMRIHQCPDITVRGLENGTEVRGIGEPPVPPAAPALANAIFAATGQRLREMPFNKKINFV